MNLTNEKKESYYRYDVEFEDDEFDLLYQAGLREIIKDKDAVINYIVNKILRDYVEENNATD